MNRLMIEARNSSVPCGKAMRPPVEKEASAEANPVRMNRVRWAVREYLPDCHNVVERYRKIRLFPLWGFSVFYLESLRCAIQGFVLPEISGKFQF